MGQFRKLPVTIEAAQFKAVDGDTIVFDIDGELPLWLTDALTSAPATPGALWIEPVAGVPTLLVGTLESPHEASPGDWIIQGVKGELYPCKPDIFERTYEAADDDGQIARCPVCAIAFKDEDMCLVDIELGICHAECLRGSPLVDLETGEPLPEGSPAPEPFRYDDDKPTPVADRVPVPKLVAAEPEDVDALSFAARTAHVSAGELYGLMMTANGMRLEDWYGSLFGDLEADVQRLAAFITGESVDNPETLWLFAIGAGIVRKEAGAFLELTFARRQAFTVFAQVCSSTFRAIRKVQEATAAELALQQAARSQPPLRRVDSILEEEGRIDELLPGVTRGAAVPPAPPRSPLDHDGDGRPGGSAPVQTATSPLPVARQPLSSGSGPGQPLSVGERLVRPPRNQGGRPPATKRRR